LRELRSEDYTDRRETQNIFVGRNLTNLRACKTRFNEPQVKTLWVSRAHTRRCNRHGFASKLIIAEVDPRAAAQMHAKVAELADAPDLGFSRSDWRGFADYAHFQLKRAPINGFRAFETIKTKHACKVRAYKLPTIHPLTVSAPNFAIKTKRNSRVAGSAFALSGLGLRR
jgi:hypothetical protein